MDTLNDDLHIFFFPFPGQGHMIPMVDMARLFAARGVRATIVTTPLNAPLISKTIGKAAAPGPGTGREINIRTIKFPCAEAGLPEGCENVDCITSSASAMLPTFFKATAFLREPLEKLLLEDHPDCLVAGMFFPWASDSAAKFQIPRLVFHGTGFFSLCAWECVRLYQPYKKAEAFVIPNLPGEIKLTRMQLPDYLLSDDESDLKRIVETALAADVRSYGVVFNSFYELEHIYADYYRRNLLGSGRKAWLVGPVSLCNRDSEEKAERGKQAAVDEQECLKWLHSNKPNSVVYVCFGSTSNFPDSQLREIAMGLEGSGQQFIWVVRRSKKDEQDKEEWLPEGFEKRMRGRGLIIKGWAPQVLILDHEAVGGFVTHCGWNSTLEAVSAGVPMVTWPVSAEQFYNEKLVTDLLEIGVPVGVKKWGRVVGAADSITRNEVERAVNRIMVGEDAEAMRNRAQKLAPMARRAVQEGGSSYSDLSALIQELRSTCH